MKSNKNKVLSLLAGLGLLAAAAGTVAADTSWSPWQFSGVSKSWSHAGLTVNYSVDPWWLADRTRGANANLVPSASFGAHQQCWNGAYTSVASVQANIFRTVTTPVCTTAQGGTAAGHVGIFH